MPGFFCISMPDIYRRQNAPGGVQIDKTRPRPEPGKKIKPHKPRGKCTLLRAGGAEQAPRGTGAYCVPPPLPQTPTPDIYYRLEKRVISQGVRKKERCKRTKKRSSGSTTAMRPSKPPTVCFPRASRHTAAQMYRGFGIRPAVDELRTAKGQLQKISATLSPAGEIPV